MSTIDSVETVHFVEAAQYVSIKNNAITVFCVMVRVSADTISSDSTACCAMVGVSADTNDAVRSAVNAGARVYVLTDVKRGLAPFVGRPKFVIISNRSLGANIAALL